MYNFGAIIVVLVIVLLLSITVFAFYDNGTNTFPSHLVPVPLAEGGIMLIEPLVVSTPDPSVLLNQKHGFIHGHRLDTEAVKDVHSIRDKFSKAAFESGSIYYIMGVGAYNPSKPEFPVDPRSFAPATVRNPTEGNFDVTAGTEVAEILTVDGKPPNHINTPHDFIHLNYIGEKDGQHLYYVLGAAKFKPPLIKQ
uniref:Uncharacterized protein n=1 Tax=Pithovirus LCPAC304 TaxID=2506594 RepID=A0A481Z8S9_9VIRU|nr:MAG: hypothetical protein LCPAC304_02360 [Pithovirus LCPAC304]